MKIVANEKLIRRNGRIGQYSSLGALAVLAVGMYISFSRPDLIVVAGVALLLGFLLSQVGIYFGSRWGRQPQPHQLLSAALKGLTNDYSLYHFNTPASHLLVGPAGIWVLTAQFQRGNIRYEKGKWRQAGGGFAARYMRLFGAENIGRPDLEARAEADAVERFLKKKLETELIPPVQAALVFVNEQAELELNDAPLPAMPAKKIKDFLRQVAKERPLSTTHQERVKSVLPTE